MHARHEPTMPMPFEEIKSGPGGRKEPSMPPNITDVTPKIKDRTNNSGGDKNDPPKHNGGGGSGGGGPFGKKSDSSFAVPMHLRWPVGFAFLLALFIAFLVIGVKRDLYKDHAIKALAVAQSIEKLFTQYAITQEKQNQKVDDQLMTTEEKVTDLSIALSSYAEDSKAFGEDLKRTKNAIEILAGSAVDTRTFETNVSKVTKLEGDVKSLRRRDIEQTAEVDAKIGQIKSEVAALSKIVTEGVPSVRGSMNGSQKGGAYSTRPTSMEYMDGSPRIVLASFNQGSSQRIEQQAKVETVSTAGETELAKLAKSAKKYYMTTASQNDE